MMYESLFNGSLGSQGARNRGVMFLYSARFTREAYIGFHMKHLFSNIYSRFTRGWVVFLYSATFILCLQGARKRGVVCVPYETSIQQHLSHVYKEL